MSAKRKPLQQEPGQEPLGMLLVISGPSGVGKDTVWKMAAQELPSFQKAITCSTRPPRKGEKQDVNYHFVSNDDFERLIHEDQLLEWAEVHGNRYGVPAAPVLERLTQGGDVCCVIDVQGAMSLRALIPNALLVFLKPPAGKERDVLKERMEQRGVSDAQELANRLRRAAWELAQVQQYDYTIVNDNVKKAATRLYEIVQTEKQKRALVPA